MGETANDHKELRRRLASLEEAEREQAITEAASLSIADLLRLTPPEEEGVFAGTSPKGKRRGVREFFEFLHSLLTFQVDKYAEKRMQEGNTLFYGALAQVLEAKDDPQVMAALLLLYSHEKHNWMLRESVCRAVVRCLPDASPESIASWPNACHTALLHLLTMPYVSVETTLAILDALGRCGQEPALPLLQAFALDGMLVKQNRGLHPPAGIMLTQVTFDLTVRIGMTDENSEPVKAAAKKAWLQIQERMHEERQQKTLLRPSTAPGDNEDLLRPVTARKDAIPPEELLRPGNPTP